MENNSLKVARFIMGAFSTMKPTTEIEYGHVIHTVLEMFRSENFTKDDFAKASDLGFFMHTIMFSKLEDMNTIKELCLEIIVREDPSLRRIIKTSQDIAEICHLLKHILDGRFVDKDYLLTAAMGMADVMIDPATAEELTKLNHITDKGTQLLFTKEIVRNLVTKSDHFDDNEKINNAVDHIMKMINDI